MNSLTGKVAIVTGASKGIGAGIAKALCVEGASVVVNYASSREGADRALAEMADNGCNAIAIQADVSEPADVKRLFVETKKAFGKLDVLVNNAGVFKFEPLEAITVAEFNREFSTNVLGPILTVQGAIREFGATPPSPLSVAWANPRISPLWSSSSRPTRHSGLPAKPSGSAAAPAKI